MDFWSQPSLGKAQRFFNQWLEEARRSCLDPVTKVAQTLCTHLGGLLTYIRHRITNALVAHVLFGAVFTVFFKLAEIGVPESPTG